jgi:aminocarboxymuconate-semialdehyde decarboxylase
VIQEDGMRNRRDFLKTMAGATAGMLLAGRGLADPLAQASQAAPVKRREVTVGGQRAKVIDIHAHCIMPEVADVIKGTSLDRKIPAKSPQILGPGRLRVLDEKGVDVQVLCINVFWWYAADRDLAAKIVDVHDQGLSKWCNAHPDRFAALSSVAMQFPDLAAQQLEHAMKNLGLRGAAVGGHVQGEPLSSPRFDPFWAKAQELGALVFMHPGGAENIVKEGGLKGRGDLGNIVGDPLETTVFLSQMIFDGTLDRFPNLKICAAHGGGYLPSYLGRTDVACEVRPNANCANAKSPREYFKDQILADSMVFEEEGLRHLVAEMGPSQVVYGTDTPFNWPNTLDLILQADFLNDAQKEMVLGGNLSKLLKI